MRSNKECVLILRVKCKCPYALACQSTLFRINSRPGYSGIDRTIHAAACFSALIGIANEDLIAIAGIDQNAGEISEGKIATSAAPICPTIMCRIKRLLGTDVDVIWPLRILRDRIHGRVSGNAISLLPGLSSIT